MAWTNEQLEAINKDGTNIIVSAGAGSGKTAVLTERVIRKLKNGVDVDRLLVLTFTNEAANEMKSRIRDAIIKNGIDSQLALLDSAYITTFDSYALSVVKKYHYLLNISNNVSIIDSNVILIYKYKVIDKIFESMYGNDLFNKLVEDFCLKDDKSLKQHIISLSDKLDLLIDKEEYLNTYLDKFYNDDYITSIIDSYVKLIRKKIIELEKIYNKFKSHITFNLDNKLNEWFKILFNGINYEDYQLFTTLDNVRFTGVSEGGKELRDILKIKVDEIKKLLRFKSIDEIKNSILSTHDYTKVIIDIVKKLNYEVKEYKSKNDIYEFNDIAHMAIDIVKNNLDVRNELKEYFNEIMVDEYQDTSSIQEEFIKLISNNNVYMVGDIKQSIYRFRNANPYIFQEKYDNYGNNFGGIKIDLLKNFRSRSETLFNINEIFNLIMDNDIGNANYLESHNMIYGNTLYDNENTGVNNKLEIYNYCMEENDLFTKEEKELFIVAEDIISKIKNKYQIFDKKSGKLRDIKYSDICIITDRNKYLDKYKKILEYKGIPSVLYKDEILTNDDDILVIKNLISLVDHVNRGVFDTKFKYLFTSAARSFLFRYNDDKIYQIFVNNSYKMDEIVTIAYKIDMYIPLNDIINSILEEYDVYNKLTTLSDIDKSLVRISNLQDIANSLSSLNYDISSFISYIDDVIESGLTVKYSVNTSNGDAVKIMNIHKSKGLEFSLCYFTGMHNKFTIREISEKILFSLNYGIILPYMEEELKDTILKDLYVDNYFVEEVSEKIRLFYVALTRCREKMIIVTSLNNDSDSYSSLVPYEERIKYRSFLDIINSLDVISKYVINKEAEYTKEYDNIKIKNIDSSNSGIVIDKKKIEINYDVSLNKHFSKENHKLLDKDTIKAMEYGTAVHEKMEYANFKDTNNQYVKNLLDKLDNNFINIYREYEFIYEADGIIYNGVIDLMLEYNDYINIIDYKLKNIEDEAYLKQMEGYRKYIESISNKKINVYLYSILDNDLRKVNL
ncbi:MAG: UvrD-helicase domain-containing protein [Bacilli bacterium]|nr:UvrD-helicase domain-containing protein [Bacilli bacterium]